MVCVLRQSLKNPSASYSLSTPRTKAKSPISKRVNSNELKYEAFLAMEVLENAVLVDAVPRHSVIDVACQHLVGLPSIDHSREFTQNWKDRGEKRLLCIQKNRN